MLHPHGESDWEVREGKVADMICNLSKTPPEQAGYIMEQTPHDGGNRPRTSEEHPRRAEGR